MQPYSEATLKSIQAELDALFSAHEAVGLKGKMCLYTHPTQDLWRSAHAGEVLWFGKDEIHLALEKVESLYQAGNLPNTSLLLNPVAHEEKDGAMIAVGSGVIWATAFCLGVAKLEDEQIERNTD